MAPTVSELIAALDRLGTSQELTNLERLEVVAALRRNYRRLQRPFERVWETLLGQPHVYAATRTLMDLGLWRAWAAAGGGDKTLDELVGLCEKRCDPNLLRRLIRLLAADDVVDETGLDRFRPTAFSTALAEHDLQLAMNSGASTWYPVCMHIPEHLASIGYQDPASADDTAYLSMPLNPEKLNFFAACRWRPNYQEEYVACMSEITRSKQDWTEYYDTDHLVDEVVLEKAQRTPVFVDISGNAGDDVMRFLKKHPNVPKGSLVLQDVPDVIDIAKDKVDPKITAMSYDIFTPQRVLNGRIYFLHSILHGWPDDRAIEILRNLRPAFKKGYSRLVIVDVVVPPERASMMQAAHDVCLLGLLAARERTQDDWARLLLAGGFEVIKVVRDAQGIESVIEAQLRSSRGAERGQTKDDDDDEDDDEDEDDEDDDEDDDDDDDGAVISASSSDAEADSDSDSD